MSKYFVIVIDREDRAHSNAFDKMSDAKARLKECKRAFGRENVYLIKRAK